MHQTVTFCRLLSVSRVLLEGEAVTQDSWFPGYAWTIAYCNRCGNHLGWRFTKVPGPGGGQLSGQGEEDEQFWGIRRSALKQGGIDSTDRREELFVSTSVVGSDIFSNNSEDDNDDDDDDDDDEEEEEEEGDEDGGDGAVSEDDMNDDELGSFLRFLPAAQSFASAFVTNIVPIGEDRADYCAEYEDSYDGDHDFDDDGDGDDDDDSSYSSSISTNDIAQDYMLFDDSTIASDGDDVSEVLSID